MSLSYDPQLDYYRLLQVSPEAEAIVIKGAYRSIARKYHPDQNEEEFSEAKMAQINQAFEVLKDPSLKQQYDQLRSEYFQASQIQATPTSKKEVLLPNDQLKPSPSKPQQTKKLPPNFQGANLLFLMVLGLILAYFLYHKGAIYYYKSLSLTHGDPSSSYQANIEWVRLEPENAKAHYALATKLINLENWQGLSHAWDNLVPSCFSQKEINYYGLSLLAQATGVTSEPTGTQPDQLRSSDGRAKKTQDSSSSSSSPGSKPLPLPTRTLLSTQKENSSQSPPPSRQTSSTTPRKGATTSASSPSSPQSRPAPARSSPAPATKDSTGSSQVTTFKKGPSLKKREALVKITKNLEEEVMIPQELELWNRIQTRLDQLQ